MQNKLIHKGAPKKPSSDFTDGSYPMEAFRSVIDKYKAKAANNLPREKSEQPTPLTYISSPGGYKKVLKAKVNNATAKLLSNYDFKKQSKQSIGPPPLST